MDRSKFLVASKNRRGSSRSTVRAKRVKTPVVPNMEMAISYDPSAIEQRCCKSDGGSFSCSISDYGEDNTREMLYKYATLDRAALANEKQMQKSENNGKKLRQLFSKADMGQAEKLIEDDDLTYWGHKVPLFISASDNRSVGGDEQLVVSNPSNNINRGIWNQKLQQKSINDRHQPFLTLNARLPPPAPSMGRMTEQQNRANHMRRISSTFSPAKSLFSSKSSEETALNELCTSIASQSEAGPSSPTSNRNLNALSYQQPTMQMSIKCREPPKGSGAVLYEEMNESSTNNFIIPGLETIHRMNSISNKDNDSASIIMKHPTPTMLSNDAIISTKTNRNSTGSANSGQTFESGFESGKSGSICHLVNSLSSGSCASSSNISQITAQTASNATILESPISCASSSSDSVTRSSSIFGNDSFDPLYLRMESASTILQNNEDRKARTCGRVNIRNMIAKGITESEIMVEWLERLFMSQYLPFFISQGYDLQTISRMTPEDLSALGISKPEDRKKLIQDIQNWNLPDSWPASVASDAATRQWLAAIGLRQYIDAFECQGYLTVNELEKLEPEDLEDIGVKKLGHIKRISLALKKIKAHRTESGNSSIEGPLSQFISPASSYSNSQTSTSTSQVRRNSLPQSPNQRYSTPSLPDVHPNILIKPREKKVGNEALSAFIFENESFGVPVMTTAVDRGKYVPPKLNLYRTSQILSNIPRTLQNGDNYSEKTKFNDLHGNYPAPPPPAPTSNNTFVSFSQPGTPRNPVRTGTFKPITNLSINDRPGVYYDNNGASELSDRVRLMAFPPLTLKRALPM